MYFCHNKNLYCNIKFRYKQTIIKSFWKKLLKVKISVTGKKESFLNHSFHVLILFYRALTKLQVDFYRFKKFKIIFEI